MKEKSKRIKKVGSLLKEVLSEVVQTEVKDPRMSTFITITEVDISNDLQHAKVYVSILGEDAQKKEILEGLESAKGYIAIAASKMVTLRYFPMLTFKIDETADKIKELDHLFKKIKKSV